MTTNNKAKAEALRAAADDIGHVGDPNIYPLELENREDAECVKDFLRTLADEWESE